MHRLPENWKDQEEPKALARANEAKRLRAVKAARQTQNIPPDEVVDLYARECKAMLQLIREGHSHRVTAKMLSKMFPRHIAPGTVSSRLLRLRTLWQNCDGSAPK